MIKKVIVKNLSSSLAYNGIGKINFYNNDNKLIEAGDVVINTTSLGETTNFSCTTSVEQAGCYPLNMIQTDSTNNYWYTDVKSNVSIEITFKKYVDGLSYFTIVSTPTDVIGVTNDFEVEFYDYEDNLLYSYTITPTNNIGEIQEVLTNELSTLYETNTLGLVHTRNASKLNNIEQILYATIKQEEEDNTIIRYLFSIDDRATYFSIVNGVKQIVDINNILIDGMDKKTVEQIADYKFETKVNLDVVVGVMTTNKLYTPILHNIKIVYI